MRLTAIVQEIVDARAPTRSRTTARLHDCTQKFDWHSRASDLTDTLDCWGPS